MSKSIVQCKKRSMTILKVVDTNDLGKLRAWGGGILEYFPLGAVKHSHYVFICLVKSQ